MLHFHGVPPVLLTLCSLIYTMSHHCQRFLNWSWTSLYRWPPRGPESWRNRPNLSPTVIPGFYLVFSEYFVPPWILCYLGIGIGIIEIILFGFINPYRDLLLVQPAFHSTWSMTLQSRPDMDPLAEFDQLCGNAQLVLRPDREVLAFSFQDWWERTWSEALGKYFCSQIEPGRLAEV